MTRVVIPNGIVPEHLAEIRKRMQSVLKDLSAQEAKQVNLRLNESDKDGPLPVFIDWVGIDSVIHVLTRDPRVLDPGLYRFGDATPSEVYPEAINKALNEIVNRDWKTKGLGEKREESKLLAQKAGVMYQKFIGIIAHDEDGKQRCVGTLTAGFKEKPDDNTGAKIDEALREIASWPPHRKSDLVKWIEDNLVVGGPRK